MGKGLSIITLILALFLVTTQGYTVTLYSTNGIDYIPITDTTNLMTDTHAISGNDILTTGNTGILQRGLLLRTLQTPLKILCTR